MPKNSALRAFVLVSLLASVAQAQFRDKTRAELPPAAQATWDDAQRIQSASGQSVQSWEKAAGKYREAYDASHNPRVLFNVAFCERMAEHFVRAVAALKQELAEGRGKLTAQERSEIEAGIKDLGKFIATLELTIDEPDATVLIDDVKVGLTPLAPVDVDNSGTRTVVIKKENFETVTKVYKMNGSTAAVRETIELVPTRSLVEITVSGAPGASIIIDNEDSGPAPFKGLLPVGKHTIKAQQAGYEVATQTVEVKGKQGLKLVFPLERERDATLRIESIEGAVIEVDGKVVGTTVWEGLVKPGPRAITVRKTGYNPGSLEFVVQKGEQATRRIPLTAEQKNEWVFWTVGSVLVVAGAATVMGFVFAPSGTPAVYGTFSPYLVPTGRGVRF